jgi:hypothetical protein
MRQPYEATDMVADFELAGGRSTGLTQLASPRFEEKEALSARQMGIKICLIHPQLGGDFRLDLNAESLTGAAYRNVRPTELISATAIACGRGTRCRGGPFQRMRRASVVVDADIETLSTREGFHPFAQILA